MRKENAGIKEENLKAEGKMKKLKEVIDSKDKELKKVLKQVDRATNMELETSQGVDISKTMNLFPNEMG